MREGIESLERSQRGGRSTYPPKVKDTAFANPRSLGCWTEVRSAGPILDIMRRSGTRVLGESRLVRLSPDLVYSAVESTPRSFVLHGRDARFDIVLEPGRACYGQGGSPEPLHIGVTTRNHYFRRCLP